MCTKIITYSYQVWWKSVKGKWPNNASYSGQKNKSLRLFLTSLREPLERFCRKFFRANLSSPVIYLPHFVQIQFLRRRAQKYLRASLQYQLLADNNTNTMFYSAVIAVQVHPVSNECVLWPILKHFISSTIISLLKWNLISSIPTALASKSKSVHNFSLHLSYVSTLPEDTLTLSYVFLPYKLAIENLYFTMTW